MKRNAIVFITVFMAIIFIGYSALAGGHGHKKTMKKGILLVAFGSSMPEAQVSF